LNFAFDIATRIAFNKQKSFSRFIIRLSTAATAISVMAMIISLSFVNGFQKTISQKVFSFWGHIRVQHFEMGKALVAEELPIAKNDTVEWIIKNQKNVTRTEVFATKSAVLEKHKEIAGILFKGIDRKYDSMQLYQFIQQGRWLQFDDSLYSKEILISAPIANELQLKVNDTLNIYFIGNNGNNSRRKLKVAGIYKTGIEEYDKLFAIGDIRLIQRINDWQPNQIGGYEVFVNDYKLMDSVNNQLADKLPTVWAGKTIQQVYPNIFDWLNIQDVNRNVIFAVMAIVAIINLITCLLILVLERTRMIGVFKAIGANNTTIQKMFLYQASFIAAAGIGIGFVAGIGICLLQQQFGFIKLDEANYYVAIAPVDIIWWQVILVSLITAIVCFLSLIIPTLLIRNIKPVKAIAFR
jgi:lipoprotein-releasing system permease protein